MKSPAVKIIAAIILILAIVAIFHIRPKRQKPKVIPVIRPLKTLVLKQSFKPPNVFLPGRVKANDQVSLAFEVSGQIVRKDIMKGQKVRKGDVLAELDPRDYQNKFKEAQAALNRSQSHYDRIAKALKVNAVSQEDMSNARAGYERAAANLDIARKALSDTVLRASFDGSIADVFVDTFTSVKAGTPIVSIQNVSKIQIEVSVPERYIVNAPRNIDRAAQKMASVARFDSLPNRTFKVFFNEFTPVASNLTQTYTATFIMPAPEDVLILPGMSVNVEIASTFNPPAPKATNLKVPSDLVAIDSKGNHYVWLILPAKDGDRDKLHQVRKCLVKVGQRNHASIEILHGLDYGQRIAAAGISMLRDGQQVHLLESPDQH